ncbi:hypothetical protein B0H10DRAFT_2083419 [Mycena sp. CBHHK59/15]|nr:hypothetical protein B0H10DRAFT_2083419 [Mycena sp. CBHHK59/15]
MNSESAPSKLELDRFGFFISPLTPPHLPDVLICSVDARFKIVSLMAALSSEITLVSTRNLSRWLFLLARGLSSARPIRPPAVYRRITVVGADIFVRLAGIGSEAFPCDSPDPLPPGCYALFVDSEPYPYPIGQSMPRPSFVETEPAWDVPDDDIRASYRMANPVPHNLTTEARRRDRGLCCLTGRPSDCIAWVIPPLLCGAVSPPAFSLEQCLCLDNVFTISLDLLRVYQNNRIAVDSQDGYRIVTFGESGDLTLLDRLGSLPTSGRFWHASLAWTLCVRFAGCDVGFGATPITDHLLEELSSGGTHMIPQEAKWTTVAGQEAIRTFFWARSGCLLPSPEEETWGTPPASPSDSTSSSSDAATSDLSDRDDARVVFRNPISGPNIFWVLFPAWWILLLIYFARICMMD